MKYIAILWVLIVVGCGIFNPGDKSIEVSIWFLKFFREILESKILKLPYSLINNYNSIILIKDRI